MIADTKDSYPMEAGKVKGPMDAFALYKDVMDELKQTKADDLRDQFAMAALQAIGIKNMRLEAPINYRAIAEVSYAIADAMLKERGNAV